MSYQVFTATDTNIALQLLADNPDIRVIFCDQRMPGKNGVEFFAEIKERFPLPIRILITAFTEIDVVIDAINNGHIFRYIRKPWIEVDVLSAINEANNYYLTSSMLQAKIIELETAYNELNKFAYSVSHDLRSPLSGILTAVDTMNEMSDLTEIREMLGLIEKSIFKLEDYIAGMHDYYRSQHGQLKINPIDFHELAGELKSMFQIYLNNQKVVLTMKVEQQGVFSSDASLVKMILNNLITNAIKYQKKQAVDKKISLEIQADQQQARIMISDTGIGIAESQYEEIFHLFSKVSSHGTGSGIGLYNVKNAVNKLGGTLEVKSIVGDGSTFTLIIPNLTV